MPSAIEIVPSPVYLRAGSHEPAKPDLNHLLPGDDVIEEIIISTYAMMNSLRIFAYLPQIVTVWRAPDRAEAVSLLTWTFWALANVATTAYSAVILKDFLTMVIFAGNSVCCALVAFIVAWKRKRYSSVRAFHNPPSPRPFRVTITGTTGCAAPWAPGRQQMVSPTTAAGSHQAAHRRCGASGDAPSVAWRGIAHTATANHAERPVAELGRPYLSK